MCLAGMLAYDRDALICDLAETYHILDYRSVPVEVLSVLAAGLRDDSRIKLKMSGLKISLDRLLMARMVDSLALLVWSKTEDSTKGRNKPKSITEVLTVEPKEETVKTYSTPEEFESAWKKITGG